jgi:dTMP kinase
MKKGIFITVDGIDGCGKTTVSEQLTTYLRNSGRVVTKVSDPGGTPESLEIRKILLHSDLDLTPRCEALLFMASRAALVDKIIIPALDRGEVVVSDRFVASTVAYQHYGANNTDNSSEFWSFCDRAAGYMPNLTIILDIDVPTARQRTVLRDRIESRSDDFFEKVRSGFLVEASKRLFEVVDASRPLGMVLNDVFVLVDNFLKYKDSSKRILDSM